MGKLDNRMQRIINFRVCMAKKAFLTQELADHAKTSNERKFGKEMRIYKCHVCKLFHLTTQKARLTE